MTELDRLETRPRGHLSHVPSPRPDGGLVVADTMCPQMAVALVRAEIERRETQR